MFSYGVAYSTHHETEYGTLATGFNADLTILAQNPFEVESHLLKDIPIQMTIVDGVVVFEKDTHY